MEPQLLFLLETMRDDIKEIREEIKELQGFRWKVAGIATACSCIIGIALKIMFP